ncbi:MAG: hypothetical protein K5930_04905 [Treponemataceae bacterium]|nr:hypothetical protein [Treponemataceae bacterium]
MLQMTELDEDSLSEASRFITQEEEDNITLSSLFHKDGNCKLPSAAQYKLFIFRDSTQGYMKGMLSFSHSGNILHCLKFKDDTEKEEFKKLLAHELPLDHIFCILGEKNGCDLIASAIKRKYKEIRSYTLMHFDEKADKLAPPQGFSLKQCGVQDLEALCPLQKSYERDEVLLNPDDFEETASRLNLRKNLREQIIYSLLRQEYSQKKPEPVAKAGTNACGLNWCQLGGIYTVPRYRGLGCAAYLAQVLALTIAQSGKKTALFVKDKNIPAQKAYIKAGFIKDKAFEIIYY